MSYVIICNYCKRLAGDGKENSSREYEKWFDDWSFDLSINKINGFYGILHFCCYEHLKAYVNEKMIEAIETRKRWSH